MNDKKKEIDLTKKSSSNSNFTFKDKLESKIDEKPENNQENNNLKRSSSRSMSKLSKNISFKNDEFQVPLTLNKTVSKQSDKDLFINNNNKRYMKKNENNLEYIKPTFIVEDRHKSMFKEQKTKVNNAMNLNTNNNETYTNLNENDISNNIKNSKLNNNKTLSEIIKGIDFRSKNKTNSNADKRRESCVTSNTLNTIKSNTESFILKKREREKMLKPKVLIKDNGEVVIEQPNYSKVNDQINIESSFMPIEERREKLTSMSFRNKPETKKWSDKDTYLFYKCLECFGTDFSLHELVFKDRNRTQIKNKYLKEEKINQKAIQTSLSRFNKEKLKKIIPLLIQEQNKRKGKNIEVYLNKLRSNSSDYLNLKEENDLKNIENDDIKLIKSESKFEFNQNEDLMNTNLDKDNLNKKKLNNNKLNKEVNKMEKKENIDKEYSKISNKKNISSNVNDKNEIVDFNEKNKCKMIEILLENLPISLDNNSIVNSNERKSKSINRKSKNENNEKCRKNETTIINSKFDDEYKFLIPTNIDKEKDKDKEQDKDNRLKNDPKSEILTLSKKNSESSERHNYLTRRKSSALFNGKKLTKEELLLEAFKNNFA